MVGERIQELVNLKKEHDSRDSANQRMLIRNLQMLVRDLISASQRKNSNPEPAEPKEKEDQASEIHPNYKDQSP